MLFLWIILQSIYGFIHSNKNLMFVTFLFVSWLWLKIISKKKLSLYTLTKGGEYQALKSFLTLHGISHFTTPSHTPEHNDYSERCLHHIVETCISLLSHASMPLSYWSYAFLTVVYPINCIPTHTLQLVSFYVKLFGQSPNYGKF